MTMQRKTISSIVRVTKRGGNSRALATIGDRQWRDENQDDFDGRALGIGLTAGGAVTFRFPAAPSQPHEYCVTLTARELERAFSLLSYRLAEDGIV